MVLKLVFLCHFEMMLSIHRVIPKTDLLLLSTMGKHPMSHSKEGNQISHLFHVFGCVCYILNKKDQCTKFEAKADERRFLSYSIICKAFSIFNLLRKIVEEIAHFSFDKYSFIHDPADHPSSVLNEHTYSPLDHIPEFLPMMLNMLFLMLINSSAHKLSLKISLSCLKKLKHPISNTLLKVIQMKVLIQEFFEIILNPKSLEIVSSNFYMFVKIFSMIETKNCAEELKEVDWIKAIKFGSHYVWNLVPKRQGKTIIGTCWVFRKKIDEDGILIRNKARLVA
uniref:Retroviral polymerase SH3-like domain-containing protein n=1 Tax=Lactuca sativa TaxID=4236 RepID=A0A9R1XJR4_LACSA|nr:hypothetical protein LSAT_V11C300127420 [Lactuca sativa]